MKSEASYSQAMKEGYASLMKVDGVGMTLAEALYSGGFGNSEEVAEASIEDLCEIEGIDEELAERILESARLGDVEEDAPVEEADEEAPTEEAPDAAEDASDDVAADTDSGVQETPED